MLLLKSILTKNGTQYHLPHLLWLFLVVVFLLSPSFSMADPWRVHKGNIRVYEKKINKLDEQIKTAIGQKNATKSPKVMKENMSELVSSHEKLKEQVAKRNKEIKHMRFRHPGKGGEFERKYYKTYRIKSLSEYEEDSGLSGQLTRLKEKIRVHYGVKTKEDIAEEKAKDKLKESVGRSIKLVK